jgi:hypothetical protein
MNDIKDSKEIFSFHLMKIPFGQIPKFLLFPMHKKNIPGLIHSESFFTMNLGQSIASIPRYNFKTFAFFAWWREETCLEDFLQYPSHHFFNDGWHVRMKLYRRWGEIKDIKNAIVNSETAIPDGPIVAVTLARLNLLQTFRFIHWGKPVEKQVRDHKGQALALAAFRPFNTFSTFSIWKNESEMINMVHGRNKLQDGENHKQAMQERIRKDFHYEFSTMRFIPLKEVGQWNNKSGYTK